MSLPYARSYDEVYLYMGLRPCPCGDTEFEQRFSASVTVNGETGERFSGHCATCGQLREFTFAMSDAPPNSSFDVQYGPEGKPSRLLDPGEWLAAADLFASSAQDYLSSEQLADDAAVTRVYYMLTSSLAALDEVLKFIPGDADEVSEASFWSQTGRLVFEMMPQRFTRAMLEDERAGLHERVAEFESEYGQEDDGNSNEPVTGSEHNEPHNG